MKSLQHLVVKNEVNNRVVYIIPSAGLVVPFGKLHNEEGPAVKWLNNSAEYYYLNDKRLSKEEWEKQVDHIKFTHKFNELIND